MFAPATKSGWPKGAFALITVLIAGYALSQFYRTSVGVIAPELSDDPGLSAAALGALGGAFFLVFAAAQLPAGVLLDRFGPRLINTVLLCVAALGAVGFGLADSAETLIAARGLIGLGCATAYMGALVLFSRWFSARRFPMLAGLVIGLGGAGSLVATTPLALVAETVGWRGAFFAVAGITVATALLVWLVVRDAPPGRRFLSGPPESLGDALRGLAKVAANRRLHRLLPINSVSYASVAAVLGLWGAPYLQDVHGLATVGAADILLATAIGLMAGSILYGWITPRMARVNSLTMSGGGVVIAVFVLLAVLPPLTERSWPLYPIFAILGLFGAYSIALIAHFRMLLPEALVGRGLTLANLFNFGGVGVVQVVSGLIIGAFPTVQDGHPQRAYSTLFLFLAGLIAVSLVIYRGAAPVAVSDIEESA